MGRERGDFLNSCGCEAGLKLAGSGGGGQKILTRIGFCYLYVNLTANGKNPQYVQIFIIHAHKPYRDTLHLKILYMFLEI